MLCTRSDNDFKEIYFRASLFDLYDGASVWMSIKQTCLLIQQWRPNGQLLRRLRKRLSTASSLVLLRISRYGLADYTLLCKYGGCLKYQGFKTSHEDRYIDEKYQVIKGFVESWNVVIEILSVDDFAWSLY